jgi:molybdenum cofactor cytidylyltransferase
VDVLSDDRDLSGTTQVPPSASCLGISPAKAGGEKTCGAVILAAGEAVRMGVAKPAMPFGDSTMIGAVITTARDAGLDPVIVVTGFHGEEVAEAVDDAARIVHNPDPGRGNMSSLLVGLDAIGDVEAVVVLLSDMPLVEPSTIDALCMGLLESGSMCGWTRYTDGRGHPIAFTPNGVEAIGGLSGTKALWPWFDSLDDHGRYELVVNDVRSPDINSPADYDNLRSFPGN